MIEFKKGTQIAGMLRQTANGHYLTNSESPMKDGKNIIPLSWLNGKWIKIIVDERIGEK